MGGQIAMHTALRHPNRVRSLALLDTSPAFGLNGTDPEEWKRLRLDGLDAGQTPASMAEPLPTHDVLDRLGELRAPTLVVVGELDEETPLSYAELIAGGIRGARLEIIPGAGHITNLEAPEAVNAALRAHLDAVEAAR
jgi:3-oxoadipate enol-lactonase